MQQEQFEKGVRPDKINYYLDIAKTVSERSTCLKTHYGSVIVKNDIIISTGYNGAPRGVRNCIDSKQGCLRELLNCHRNEGYELCPAVHSEQNAIISAARKDMIDSDLYMVGINVKDGSYKVNAMCCNICKAMIINAGIKRVYIRVGPKQFQWLCYEVDKFIEEMNELANEE